MMAFSGEWHTRQSWYTADRTALLGYPGKNKHLRYTSFKHPGLEQGSVPVNRDAVYVIPSGYTVTAGVVIKARQIPAADPCAPILPLSQRKPPC